MNIQPISGGFSDAPRQSATAFRSVLEVMSRPGKTAVLSGAKPPAPLSIAAGTAILTLADSNTPVHLAGVFDCDALRQWITFHTGAPLVPADEADLAIGHWHDLEPLDRFRIGSPEYPDRSSTLIVELHDWPQENARLTGPGIKTKTLAFVPGNRPTDFPLGLDLIMTMGERISALPRSTEVEFL
ncbi:phosphonate C-P lyase system protein PhnH [Paracoccus aestuariivivens]|uniref:Phosphonate C-P lyase system protein PhnH n=1 Tax=Paracoccus aestuariivivens TaxID=1820333 RepID=A0A6L6JEU4_9RHOB|nr:phosphonate C-P lyase system protein PhnH [Paracoccus aestuariivivens]MTH79107.1 phosphonate C-P lyase system protein PhnH [Paracoccus aestuariivivens]